MKSLLKEDASSLAIEYALMAGLIAVAIASAVGPISTILSTILFGKVAGKLAIASAVSPLVLLAVMLVAAVTDLQKCKIPNWITMPAMTSGLLGHTLVDGLPGMLFSCKGLALGFALFLILYAVGGMGAGDVKLLAAVGSFIGAEGVLSAGIMAMLLGGLYTIAMMISCYGARVSLQQMVAIFKSILMAGSFGTFAPAKAQPQLRYALAIGLGTLVSQWLDAPFFTF
jgi:prepilin peptidase CpaA